MSENDTALVPTGRAALARMLTGAQPEIAKVAESGVSLDRLFTLVRSVMSADKMLSEVLDTREGVISAVTATTKLAELGLEPTGRTGGAYLVAYNTNVGDRERPAWRKLVQVIPDWRAYLRWAVRDGLADDIIARAVHESDEFRFEIDTSTGREAVLHTFDPFGERGKRRGWYVAIIKAGQPPRYEFMSMSEIAKRRGVSKTDKVWNSWPEEMERKTVVRWAIDRRLPLGAYKLSALMAADDETAALDVTPTPALAELPEGRRMTITRSKRRQALPAPEPTPDFPDESPAGDESAIAAAWAAGVESAIAAARAAGDDGGPEDEGNHEIEEPGEGQGGQA